MSSKTVAQKLQIKPNATLWSSHPEHLELIGPLPDGTQRVERFDQPDVALFFVENEATLREQLGQYGAKLDRPGVVWFVYPKGNKSDVNRDSLWPIVAERDLRPVGQVAVDDVWSALRFRQLKEGEKQFSGGKK